MIVKYYTTEYTLVGYTHKKNGEVKTKPDLKDLISVNLSDGSIQLLAITAPNIKFLDHSYEDLPDEID
jgi:hypothetical protein